jgi:PBSX family phage terminase large subunit
MKATRTIQWSPFSQKHKNYIKKGLECKMSVAEGAIRSGKTTDNCIIAAAALEVSPDRLHLATGSTVANAKLNIGDCNGFGLEYLFRGRCKWTKFKDNDALQIYTKTGTKVVIFAGGGKADSYKKILGNSYGIWIATEINEHYDSDDSRTSFIKVAFGRQAAAKAPKVLWDMNPSDPNAKIYRDYIEPYKLQYIGGYNYELFTMKDNLSIPPERQLEIESQYIIGSIWYRRDILGQRCIATGLVYDYLANHLDEFKVGDDYLKGKNYFIECGLDFGGDRSATTMVASAIIGGFEELVIVDSEIIRERIDTVQLQHRFENFIQRVYKEHRKVPIVNCDSAESVLIHTLNNYAKMNNMQCRIAPALKCPIIERIRMENRLIAEKRFKIIANGKNIDMMDAFLNATWEVDKVDTRLDVVSFYNPVDLLDAFEYSFEKYILKFARG